MGSIKRIGEKVTVCGRAGRWWDGEIKGKIRLRRHFKLEIYRIKSREDRVLQIMFRYQKWYLRRN